MRKGEIKFIAHGERMRGGWVLVRMHTKEKRENWLLIKERDEFAEDDDSLTSRFPNSVSTRRTRTADRKGRAGEGPAKAQKAKLPAFVPPQLCSIAETPPEGEDWIYETQIRRLSPANSPSPAAQAELYTRSGLDWTEKFAAIADDARAA